MAWASLQQHHLLQRLSEFSVLIESSIIIRGNRDHPTAASGFISDYRGRLQQQRVQVCTLLLRTARYLTLHLDDLDELVDLECDGAEVVLLLLTAVLLQKARGGAAVVVVSIIPMHRVRHNSRYVGMLLLLTSSGGVRVIIVIIVIVIYQPVAFPTV